ncbi:MAG: tetratricopeptide repeat protein [Cyanobacteria bacterium P01_F01_bin.56]
MAHPALPSQLAPTPEAVAFLHEILRITAESGQDQAAVHACFRDNIDKLADKTLRSAIPAVFAELTQDADPGGQGKIASDFNSLGVDLADFPLGNRALNLEIAIAAYEAALQVYTRDALPQDWAMTQNNLGTAYRNRIRGERADNLEQAITAYEAALQVRTRDAFPQDWAMTQNNLGNAYSNRIRGEWADNLEQAIAAYEAALQVRTRDAFSEDWAMTQNNLGNAYGDRIRGERADNLERAIAAYEAALQVYTRDAFPQDWAMTQNNLGSAYQNRIRGERADNLEQAITAYEAALQVRTRDAFPQDWAMTQNNLGNAYKNRIQGERADNLERAIAAYEAALQVRTRDALPQAWALSQGVLVSALLERFKLTGETADLDEAITALEAAGTVATPGTDSSVWIYYTLGTALDYRYSLHRDPPDLAQAAAAYRNAADTTPWPDRQLTYREKAADSQYQLGIALTQDGAWYDGLAQLEGSLQTYREAESRLGRADALQQMARVHYLMSNFDKSRMYFRDALRLYQAEDNALGEANCRTGLGRLLLRLIFVDEALAELDTACTLYRQLDQPERLQEAQETYALAQKVKEKQPL